MENIHSDVSECKGLNWNIRQRGKSEYKTDTHSHQTVDWSGPLSAGWRYTD